MDREQLKLASQAAGNLIVSAWTFQKMEQHHSTKRFEDCEKVVSQRPSFGKRSGTLHSTNKRLCFEYPVSPDCAMILDNKVY